jgi:hypothetical protein
MGEGTPGDSTRIGEETDGPRNTIVGGLKKKYSTVFDEGTCPNRQQFLFRRIAWRIQAKAWGGLSGRAGQ